MAQKILVLDNNESRHKFLKEYLDGDLCQAWNADDAVKLLADHAFDEVWLDYGLGTGQETGMAVVDFIASLPTDEIPAKVVVHSVNTEKSWLMVKKLRLHGVDTDRRPFFDLLPKGGKNIV